MSSTILTLLIIPAIYSLWKEAEVRRTLRSESTVPASVRTEEVEVGV